MISRSPIWAIMDEKAYRPTEQRPERPETKASGCNEDEREGKACVLCLPRPRAFLLATREPSTRVFQKSMLVTGTRHTLHEGKLPRLCSLGYSRLGMLMVSAGDLFHQNHVLERPTIPMFFSFLVYAVYLIPFFSCFFFTILREVCQFCFVSSTYIMRPWLDPWSSSYSWIIS